MSGLAERLKKVNGNYMFEAYKIMQKTDKKQYKTLYHGVNNSKTLETYKVYNANCKMAVDGSGQKPYKTGFHTFKCLDYAKKYMQKFNKDNLVILQVYVSGMFSKPTNKNVILSEKMMITGIEK